MCAQIPVNHAVARTRRGAAIAEIIIAAVDARRAAALTVVDARLVCWIHGSEVLLRDVGAVKQLVERYRRSHHVAQSRIPWLTWCREGMGVSRSGGRGFGGGEQKLKTARQTRLRRETGGGR